MGQTEREKLWRVSVVPSSSLDRFPTKNKNNTRNYRTVLRGRIFLAPPPNVAFRTLTSICARLLNQLVRDLSIRFFAQFAISYPYARARARGARGNERGERT